MINEKQVKHIAKLARIKLTEKEEEKFAKEISSILDYIDKLNEVDTKNISPISQVTGLKNMVRDDSSPKKEKNEKILNQAPDKKDNYFKVPKILD
ncbi:MAG: Asp-tRNA(Asn)/Glu-tRNA(Gln) amidotransferase subunit GatC [Candidatus Portnoybacteria bacterium]|nr:Asp-tRNA(Asn)/Glu-tRNA(Gln) amidotransferase subunit GatC [Candidatus Portnoybacteria bacterium]